MAKDVSKRNGQESDSATGIPLWIDEKWFIPVDEMGRCIGPCAEGALGFIVQLRCLDNPDHVLALKLPRLMGETYRENAYISDLMEKELKAVYDIHLGCGKPEGLMGSGYFGRGGPLKGMVNSKNGPVEARQLHNGLLLVSFEKGHNPRFCAVVADGDGVKCFPETIKDCPVTSADQITKIEKQAQSNDLPWSSPVFIEASVQRNRGSGAGPRIFNKDYALEKSPTGQTWYTCIPSVAYSWAPGTLQESISLGKRENWRVSDHFALLHRVISALNVLHGQKMLHGDIRPANIAYQRNPVDPGNYSLTDFGSFHEAGPHAAGKQPQGGTALGPVIGTERASAFYSAERRAGREREAADTAAVISPLGSTTLLLVLGWRSALVDPATSKVRQNVAQDAKKQLQSGEEIPADSLSEGDRVQIRDYIFEVIKSRELGDRQILLCRKSPSWKVYQGRIVVMNDDVFPESHWFPIPRTIELRQWSAATDMYSIGALFLYSLYRGKELDNQQDSGQVEEDFRVMLGYLESPPYFNSIWKDLEPLRYALETTLIKRADLSPKQFTSQPYRNLDGEEEPLTDIDDEGGVPSSNMQNRRVKSLLNKTVEVIRRMTRTVPGIRRLVDEFDGELGAFILYIHFVLCCIHRQSHFNSQVLDFKIIAKSKDQVFCKDRRDAPRDGGPAATAAQRIKLIRKLLEDPKLSALKSAADMGDFDPRPDPTIREELRLLYEELDNFRNQNRDLTNQLLLKTVLKLARNSRAKFAELDGRATKILEQTQCPASRIKDVRAAKGNSGIETTRVVN